jgi:uncharacterized membrane protein YdjX (TVP38/TMEM64 family)
MRLEPGTSESTSDLPTFAAVTADAAAPVEKRAPALSSPLANWLVAGVALVVVVALVRFGPQLWGMVQDEAALEAWVRGLGWLGPLALVALNALQIVIAPIPGYVVQIAAGFLFGPVWGGVWASIGLLLGASAAFWLARLYGRPLVGRLVGDERLAEWEHILHSDSLVPWFVLLAVPIGDLPYFLAGLARLQFAKLFVMTLAVRVPSTFVVTAAGAGVMVLSWWQIALIMVALLSALFLFVRYQTHLMAWADRLVGQRVLTRFAQDQSTYHTVEREKVERETNER